MLSSSSTFPLVNMYSMEFPPHHGGNSFNYEISDFKGDFIKYPVMRFIIDWSG